MDVLSAWFTLTFTHRYEVMSIRAITSALGLPLQLVADTDTLLLGAAVSAAAASVSKLAFKNRSGYELQ